VPPLEASV
jgi:hypothetical protein